MVLQGWKIVRLILVLGVLALAALSSPVPAARLAEFSAERSAVERPALLAQRPVGREADRNDRLYQESIDRQRQLQQERQRQQDFEQRQRLRQEDDRQRRIMEDTIRRSRPSSEMLSVPQQPVAGGGGRGGGGCYAMAFDSEGNGLRVTRRGGHERDCEAALALCQEAVAKGKSARIRNATCRVVTY